MVDKHQTTSTQAIRLYRDLADWYSLLTPVSDYAEEAAFYRRLFEAHCQRPPRTLLDLGSGGGHNAASPRVRLEQMARLVTGGIATEARLVPILPGLTDAPNTIDSLFSAIARTGVKRAAASTLFLRPAITGSLIKGVSQKKRLEDMLQLYKDARRLAVHAERSSVIALPRAIREGIYTRFGQAASKHGIELSVCACMNPDIAGGTCNISGVWSMRSGRDVQLDLFFEGV